MMFPSNVYEAKIEISLSHNIEASQMPAAISKFLDSVLSTTEDMATFHEKNCYKGYTFDSGYPVERNKIYKKGKTYTVTVRTISEELLDIFLVKSLKVKTDDITGMKSSMNILPCKTITKLYSITPAVIKDEKGYWTEWMDKDEFKKRIFVNLVKKWNYFTGENMDEDFSFINDFLILNSSAIKVPYKGISLLGDKVEFTVADNEKAQQLAYIALGTGILENNARGCGFVNCKGH